MPVSRRSIRVGGIRAHEGAGQAQLLAAVNRSRIDGRAGEAGMKLPAGFQSTFLYAACFASFAAGFVSVEDDLLSDSI